MDKTQKYKYRCRPEYGSGNLLIEVISGVENDTFGTDLFDAIKEINPQLAGLEDLWMNDEILYIINSDLGDFTLSRDVWDLAFIMCDHNQACISKINTLLLNDNRFEKIELLLT